jgi:hypothetical protein
MTTWRGRWRVRLFLAQISPPQRAFYSPFGTECDTDGTNLPVVPPGHRPWSVTRAVIFDIISVLATCRSHAIRTYMTYPC